MLAQGCRILIFPRDARNLDLNVQYSDLNIGNLLLIVTKGQCRLTKQDTQTKAEGHILLGYHQFLTSDLTHSRCSTKDDQMNCISVLYVAVWSSVIVYNVVQCSCC